MNIVDYKEIKGLSSWQVNELREIFGYNEIPCGSKFGVVNKFISVFKEPMFLLLFGTSLLYFILGEISEAYTMLFFVAFVSGITFVQEWRTEKSLEALKKLTASEVTVLRDSKKEKIKSVELVPGDIVYISEGERIPADGEVIEASSFYVDESLLTGEAEPVLKKVSNYEKKDLVVNEGSQRCLYSGTISLYGSCIMKVKSTGINSEYGKISRCIKESREVTTPLQKKVGSLVKSLAAAGMILCVLAVLLDYLNTGNILKSLMSGITLAMAIIPEEFPVVLTVFLSLGAYRLSKNHTLMRKVSAVETLGSATVLAVDKTGTITNNDMELVKICTDKIYNAEEYKDKALRRLMILSCEKEPNDSMEKAMLLYADNFVNEKDKELLNNVKVKIPFNPETKRTVKIYNMESGYYAAVKGSVESVLHLCNLPSEIMDKLKKDADSMAEETLRIIVLADVHSDILHENVEDYVLNFRGIIGFRDTVKEGVKECIEVCRKAGIRVVMITGDYSKTAMSIGREAGLILKGSVITGEQLDKMNDLELKKAVNVCNIFSRVIPEHKMRIVKALQENGEIVAMTGDGVNDAPALKNADIGIAMGERGTEVAKEAAHMVLMDDNFQTIVNSIKDGRRIFDNIRKAMVYIMVLHIPIIAIALLAPLFSLPQLLLPVHILFLEMIIDPTCSIVFEGEEAEAYIMNQQPRSPKEPLLTRGMVFKVILQGFSMFIAAFVPFNHLLSKGVSVETARSFALITIAVSNVVLVMVNRSNTEMLFNIFRERKNTARLLINSLAVIMAAAITYIPFLQEIFKTASLSLTMVISAVLLGIVSSVWWEAVKLYGRKPQELLTPK
ncbi:cation-translocating P-type ATPase [Clostridium polynesiense]|uniref:cation-translocating P-type ATPase n=1 Tax=Clostridium polynesiense TaxID=1325933 RepID=UPI000B236CB7|nr:cation-translocating P-type ATPase [Clostridium polynesiense]